MNMSGLIIDNSAMRDKIMLAIWDAHMEVESERELAKQHSLDFELFKKKNDENEVIGISIGDELAGGAIVGNRRMHIAIKKRFRASWMVYFKRLMNHVFDRYGSPLSTSASIKNVDAIRFLGRVGCVLVKKDEVLAHYMIVREEMYYGRNR